MKAMIFAAGIGSRLGQLTHNTPKCLMPLDLGVSSSPGARTILEHVITRLKAATVDEVVINLHHHPEQIIEYVSGHANFGVTVHYSHEPSLLDTGGGLKRVRSFFEGREPFFVHNSDIYCTHDLRALLSAHCATSAVATLGVMQRESKRGLYFNRDRQLTGWTGEQLTTHQAGMPADSSLFAFSGISVCSSEIFTFMDSRDTFSIIESFLVAARATGRVYGHTIPTTGWVDIGTPERLHALQRQLGRGEPRKES
jgi:MurNAc alpha-1-phosphate uridylyltransferase